MLIFAFYWAKKSFIPEYYREIYREYNMALRANIADGVSCMARNKMADIVPRLTRFFFDSGKGSLKHVHEREKEVSMIFEELPSKKTNDSMI